MVASTKLRKDAALNRARIVEVGQAYLAGGRQLQLNDIARDAGVGVATVYRHFPTPEALLEQLALPRMEELEAAGRSALESDDLWPALEGFLRLGLQAQLSDPALAAVLAAPEHVDARTVELVASLNSIAMRLVDCSSALAFDTSTASSASSARRACTRSCGPAPTSARSGTAGVSPRG